MQWKRSSHQLWAKLIWWSDNVWGPQWRYIVRESIFVRSLCVILCQFSWAKNKKWNYSFISTNTSSIYNPLGTGSDKNLDLNLGIAPPLVSELQKNNSNLSSFPVQLGCDDIPIHMRTRVMLRSTFESPTQLNSPLLLYRSPLQLKLLPLKHFIVLFTEWELCSSTYEGSTVSWLNGGVWGASYNEQHKFQFLSHPSGNLHSLLVTIIIYYKKLSNLNFSAWSIFLLTFAMFSFDFVIGVHFNFLC